MTDRLSKSLISFAIYLVVAGALLGLDEVGWLGWLRGGFGVMANPVTEAFYSASLVLSKPVEGIKFAFLGAKRIENMEMRLAELAVNQAELEQLREENQAMRRLLSAPVPADWDFAPVKVVGRAERLSIGLDSGLGVKEGQLVVDEVGVLVGRVERVAERVAQVEVPIGAGVKIAAEVVGKGTVGVLVGDGKNIELTQVLQEESLAVGDTIATLGRDGEYQAGVIIGRVAEVYGEAADVYKKAKIEPLTDYGKLRRVFVMVED